MSIQTSPSECPPKYDYGQPTNVIVQQPPSLTTSFTDQYSNNPQEPGGPRGYQAPFPGPYQHPQPPPPPPPQQQQPQQVVVISQNTTATPVRLVETFVGQTVTACHVRWCCNFPFGLVGYILAVVAGDKAGSDPATANKLGKASYGVSISGIIVSIIIIGIFVGVSLGTASSSASGGSGSRSGSSCSYYSYSGKCY
jgi:hypothetical protein